MKIIKQDHPAGSCIVVERFAIFPTIIYERKKNSNVMGKTLVFLKKYWELHQVGIPGYFVEGQSSWNPNEWDFKWTKRYLDLWR